jgi:glutathione-specific gamma-glutamylcyclotransferase
MTLTRIDLESSRLQAMISQAGLGLQILTELQLQQSIDEILQQSLASNVWIFAYGSLIWNPIFKYSDRCVGTVYGWHRRFCLWTPLGRGTPDHPGLVLGLDRGGSCRGIVYQLDASDVATELLLLWRREMVAGTYIPRWVKVVSKKQTIKAIAFIINPHHSLYAPKLSLDDTAYAISKARGALGSCADYLLQTVEGLAELGIVDRTLIQIRDRVLSLLNSNLNQK